MKRLLSMMTIIGLTCGTIFAQSEVSWSARKVNKSGDTMDPGATLDMNNGFLDNVAGLGVNTTAPPAGVALRTTNGSHLVWNMYNSGGALLGSLGSFATAGGRFYLYDSTGTLGFAAFGEGFDCKHGDSPDETKGHIIASGRYK